MKLWHSGLPWSLRLTLPFKRVGLIVVVDFPSGPKPCCSRLPFLVFWPNRKLCWVQGFSASKSTPSAPFLKPSFASTYATCEYVKLGVELSPTLRFVTQTATGVALRWSKLGRWLGKPPHLKVCLEGHVTLPWFRDVNIFVDVYLGWLPLAFSPSSSLSTPFWISYFLIDKCHLHCVFVLLAHEVYWVCLLFSPSALT